MIIFTDLDGSLLQVETYSFEPAIETVHRLRAAGIPLIFCSSKTRLEQEYYQRALGISSPMIIENGAAILLPRRDFPDVVPEAIQQPEYQVIEYGAPVEFIRARLAALRTKGNLPFQGLSELSEVEMEQWTGLSGEAARRAQQREYSDTLIGTLTESHLTALGQKLLADDLAITKGTRFYTVTSIRNDKGRAVRRVMAIYRERWGEDLTVAIGDGRNDLAMLKAVDRGFLLQRDPEEWRGVDLSGIQVVPGIGPACWREVVDRLL